MAALIALPHGSTPRLRLPAEPPLRERVDLNLHPFQPSSVDGPAPVLVEFRDRRFVKNEAAYATNAALPAAPCAVAALGRFRDLEPAQVSCAAGRYNPVRERLELYASVSFEIAFEGGRGTFLTGQSLSPFESAARLQHGAVLNREALDRSSAAGLTGRGTRSAPSPGSFPDSLASTERLLRGAPGGMVGGLAANRPTCGAELTGSRPSSVAERIQRAGALPAEDALPIVRQLADALGAAHNVGVVHRDMKSGNVLLVPAVSSSEVTTGGSGRTMERAVVTDFGVARGMQPATGGHDETLTAQSELVGTPAYMSPEQVTGDETTPASDIYSFGVVIYEMLTGRRPFTGGTQLAVATKRLHEDPPPPRTHVPGLSPRVEAVVLKCLERAPGARYASADEVGRAFARALEGPPAPNRRRWITPLLLSVALALVAGVAIVLMRRPVPAAPPAVKEAPKSPAVKARRSVAVLGFRNLGGRAEVSWIATALSEMLASELGTGDVLRLVSGESVARAKRDLHLPEAETLAADSLGRVRAALAADVVVLGSYLVNEADGGVRLNVFLQDTQAGETAGSLVVSGTVKGLPELATDAGAQLRQRLGIAAGGPTSAPGLVTDAEASRAYSEGLERLRAFDWLAARDLLQKAVARQPRFTLAHAALAEALARLGYDGGAQAEARLALSLAEGLPRDQQLALTARLHELAPRRRRARGRAGRAHHGAARRGGAEGLQAPRLGVFRGFLDPPGPPKSPVRYSTGSLAR